ncbi:MAG: hypothetical protein WCX97_01395 [Candidatus Magasanikbacteria bacterium]
MTKKSLNLIILIAFVTIVIVGTLFMFNKTSAPTSGTILYYGQQCPHCIKVEEFIKNNNLDTKIQITKKEIWYNQANAAEMINKANICGLPTATVGVPFLWDGTKCYTGDTDIINWLASNL